MDGHRRERQVKAELESQGWWVCRAAGSLGDADLVALRADRAPHLIEVKANKAGGRFKNFGPDRREQLLSAAGIAGAQAVLAYWPAHSSLTFVYPEGWPA